MPDLRAGCGPLVVMLRKSMGCHGAGPEVFGCSQGEQTSARGNEAQRHCDEHSIRTAWEQALRHKLPAVLQHVVHVASETRFALDESKDVIPQLQRAVKETAERNKQLERQLELRCTCGQVAEDSD